MEGVTGAGWGQVVPSADAGGAEGGGTGTGDHHTIPAHLQKAQEIPEKPNHFAGCLPVHLPQALQPSPRQPSCQNLAAAKQKEKLVMTEIMAAKCPDGAELCSKSYLAFSNNFQKKSCFFCPILQIYGWLKLDHSKVVKCLCSRAWKLVLSSYYIQVLINK